MDVKRLEFSQMHRRKISSFRKRPRSTRSRAAKSAVVHRVFKVIEMQRIAAQKSVKRESAGTAEPSLKRARTAAGTSASPPSQSPTLAPAKPKKDLEERLKELKLKVKAQKKVKDELFLQLKRVWNQEQEQKQLQAAKEKEYLQARNNMLKQQQASALQSPPVQTSSATPTTPATPVASARPAAVPQDKSEQKPGARERPAPVSPTQSPARPSRSRWYPKSPSAARGAPGRAVPHVGSPRGPARGPPPSHYAASGARGATRNFLMPMRHDRNVPPGRPMQRMARPGGPPGDVRPQYRPPPPSYRGRQQQHPQSPPRQYLSSRGAGPNYGPWRGGMSNGRAPPRFDRRPGPPPPVRGGWRTTTPGSSGPGTYPRQPPPRDQARGGGGYPPASAGAGAGGYPMQPIDMERSYSWPRQRQGNSSQYPPRNR